MPPDTLLNVCARYIGEIGPNVPISFFEELPREVLERLIKFMCAETLNRLKPLIDKYKLTKVSEKNWRQKLSDRFGGMEKSTWLNGTITDDFLETKNISNHQHYMNKHFNSICSWLLDDHLHGFSENPYKVLRTPVRLDRKTQELAIVTDEDKKLDLKNIIKHVTKFSLHGRYSSQYLDESYILHLLVQSITHLEVSLVCDSNIKSVLEILKLFMSAGKITSISLCQILVTDTQLLRQLLVTCAGDCEHLNQTDLKASFIPESDLSGSDSDAASDSSTELDLLDEALIADKQRNKSRKICPKIDLSRHKSEVTSLSFNKYDNLEMISVLAEIIPSWTYLKQLSVYGLADKDTDRRLIKSILPLIHKQQLSHLCLKLFLAESENLALIFNELIKSYSPLNVCYDQSKYLEVLAIITPFQTMEHIDTSNKEVIHLENLEIPDVCNLAKYMKIHTRLFDIKSVGHMKLCKLLQVNQLLEGLDLKVSGTLINFISNSKWQLKKLCLNGCLSDVAIGHLINLIRKENTVTNLSLADTSINLSKSDDLCSVFIKELCNHPTLKKLDLSSNHLGKQALIILEAILQGDGHIECLDISYNKISLLTIYHFITDLSHKPIKHKLRELYIAEYIFGLDIVWEKEISAKIFKITETFVDEGIMRLTLNNGAHNLVEYEAVM